MEKLFVILLICLPFYALTQNCSGNLGDNIFEEGDFGSGVPNILTPNPLIAPDYGYSTNPPPFDGSYVVTNNTGAWTGLFPSWLAIGDNSDDPNGYMMVVNADFTPALFYNQTIDELCESTQYEFSADIINLIRVGVADHIRPNVSFLIDGVEQFTTGEIPETDAWQTYGFTFTTGPGVTDVQLSLRNNAPGGIGNDLALDNISFRTCGDNALILPEEPANICVDGEPLPLFTTVEGDLYANPSVQWQISPDGLTNWTDIPGANDMEYLHTILASGEYFYRYQLADGPINLLNEKCRINSNVKTVIVLPTEFTVQDTICAGGNLIVGTSVYSESGIYVDSLLNVLGCDSIITTELVVLDDPAIQATIDVEATSCFGEEDGRIEIVAINGGTPPYTISFAGEEVGETTIFENLEGDQRYDLVITDRFGCSVLEGVEVPSPQRLTLDLGEMQFLELGQSTSVAADANFTIEQFFWTTSNGDSLNCVSIDNCPKIDWLPTGSQVVRLTAIDANNCMVADSVNIKVFANYRIYAPNVFSPNDDGLNDRFTIFGPQPRITNILELQVFDRWGQLVFSNTNLTPGDLSQGWDGTIKGEPANEGVYVFRTRIQFLDGEIVEKGGDVAILR